MKYEYWFANVKGVGNQTKKKIRESFHDAREIYELSEALMIKRGLDPEIASNIQAGKSGWDLDGEYEKLLKKEVKMYTAVSEDYPVRLKEIPAPPYALYVKGHLPDDTRPSVAVIGARECSAYGEMMARRFSAALAGAGVQVVSGMARGIDGIGEKAALDAKGDVYGVLGCGVDVCYPRENYNLYTRLAACGGVISEQPLGAKPLARYFPARNRIISGLCDIVLVIEARERSGSLITADQALEQGRDVYALPGPVTSELSRGCHRLIKQGAGILISPEDFLEETGLFVRARGRRDSKEPGSMEEEHLFEHTRAEKDTGEPGSAEDEKHLFEHPRAKNDGAGNDASGKLELEPDEKVVYSCFDFYAKSLTQAAGEAHLTAAKAAAAAVSLELKGLIREVSKNHYVRIS